MIGLQEVVQAEETTTLTAAMEDRMKRWDLLLSSHLLKLCSKAKYTLLSAKAALGMAIFLYAKKEAVHLLSDIVSAKVKTATSSAEAKQGAMILR